MVHHDQPRMVPERHQENVLVVKASGMTKAQPCRRPGDRCRQERCVLRGVRTCMTSRPGCDFKCNQEGVIIVAKNSKQTGKKAASNASKVLANPKSTKAEKSAAASALAQTPSTKKKK